MTVRLWAVLSAALGTTLCALSLGGRLFYLFTFMLLLLMVFSLFSTLAALKLLSFTQKADNSKAERGSLVNLTMTTRLSSPLPIAPLRLEMILPDGRGDTMIAAVPYKNQNASFTFSLLHVGVFEVGVKRIHISDLFGLFRLSLRPKGEMPKVISLPLTFGLEEIRMTLQDDGLAFSNRSGEDITSPEDTRVYRQGDALKRIHWKLSHRLGELIVRRYDVPQPPDTLILLDCSIPVGWQGQADGLDRLKDALCETVLSVAKMQLGKQQPVRVPFYGEQTGEFYADHIGSISLLKEELAYRSFKSDEQFSRILSVELRRMRRTGATVVVTTRLDADLVKAVKNIRRSGPYVRFYYISFNPDSAENLPYVTGLQHHLVEVCYVTPA